MVNGTIGGGITSPRHETLIATHHSCYWLITGADQFCYCLCSWNQCQLVLLPLLFMCCWLLPPVHVKQLCCQFLVKLPVVLLLVGGVANINCTALKFSPAGCCPLLLLVSTGYAVDHLCCWLVCHRLLVPINHDDLCCWLAILPIIEADQSCCRLQLYLGGRYQLLMPISPIWQILLSIIIVANHLCCWLAVLPVIGADQLRCQLLVLISYADCFAAGWLLVILAILTVSCCYRHLLVPISLLPIISAGCNVPIICAAGWSVAS